MGKVYDALRRAEEERTRRQDGGAAPPPPAPRDPMPEVPAREIASPPRRARASAPATTSKHESRRFWKRIGSLARAGGQDSSADLNKRRITLLQPESFVAEQFRTLRARIDSIANSHPETPIHTVAVTSALRGDGKTTAAIGLAVVTAMSVDRKVLLLDADMRDPTVHKALGLRVDAGLAEVLRGDAQPEEAIQKVEGSELEVLAVRSIPANPAELLGSSAMHDLLKHLSSRYDRVVLDLPPALGLPDAKVVSEMCDGVVFVVRADTTPEDDVSAALELLDRRRILGLLLNGAELEAARYDYRG